MTYEMMGSPMPSALRPGCDHFDLPSNTPVLNNNYNSNTFNGNNNYATTPNNYGNNSTIGMGSFPLKPLALSYSPSPRPHLSIAEQAEMEFELRYRANMIVDQQRKIQQLEEELKRARDQMDIMGSQISSYEQERLKERKKPQSRYWTPDEHQRFLEALNKYGHKDVKAISIHVSTRNATQVRTHAQKYFLRLERERRKKGDDDGTNRDKDLNDGYNSSGDELYSDQSLSPVEDLSPTVTTPPQSVPQISSSLPSSSSLMTQSSVPRRRRSASLITPSMGKLALQHRDAVLAELPSWTSEDYDLFVNGLLSMIDRQEDINQVCRVIQDGFLPSRGLDELESCYRVLYKVLKQKMSSSSSLSLASASSSLSSSTPPALSSPKRRRTSKPELPTNFPMLNQGEGPLPTINLSSANGSNNIASGSSPSSFGTFMSTLSGSLPPPQYMNANNGNSSANGNGSSLLPYQQTSSLSGMTMMRSSGSQMHDYGSMTPLPMSSMSLGVSSLGMGMSMMDVSSSLAPSSSSSLSSNTSGSNPMNHQHHQLQHHHQQQQHQQQQQQQQQQGGWNSIAYSFDLHHNPSSLSLPQAAPLVSSHN